MEPEIGNLTSRNTNSMAPWEIRLKRQIKEIRRNIAILARMQKAPQLNNKLKTKARHILNKYKIKKMKLFKKY